MADVSRSRRERAQIIIVAGLLVAVSFVLLALLLNTVIFSENLAARGTDAGGTDALEHQQVVIDGIGELMDEENDREHVNYSAVNDSVHDGIEEMDDLISHRNVERGFVADIDEQTVTTHEGKLIRQTNSSRAFTDNSNNATSWVIANDVRDTRQYSLTVDHSSLAVTNQSAVNVDRAFHINLTSVSGEWRVYIYKNETTNETAVATWDGTAATELCSVNHPNATIDLSSGKINNKNCPDLQWAEGLSANYDIWYKNADNAGGTYNLTINSTSVTNQLNDGTTSTESPYHVPAVYSSAVTVSYETAELSYRSRVRIARGEPP